MQLHARWRRLDDTDKALAYLRATVVNRSRSALRHRRVVERHLAGRSPTPDAPSAESGAIERLRHEAVIAVLRDAAGPAAGGAGPALLRGPVRGGDRRGDGVQPRCREEPHRTRYGHAASADGALVMTLSDDELRRVLDQQAGAGRVRAGRPRRRSGAASRPARARCVGCTRPVASTRPRGGAMFAISTGTGVAVAATVVAVGRRHRQLRAGPARTGTTGTTPATPAADRRPRSPTSGPPPRRRHGQRQRAGLLHRRRRRRGPALPRVPPADRHRLDAPAPGRSRGSVTEMIDGGTRRQPRLLQLLAGRDTAVGQRHGLRRDRDRRPARRHRQRRTTRPATGPRSSSWSGPRRPCPAPPASGCSSTASPVATVWKSKQKVGGTLHARRGGRHAGAGLDHRSAGRARRPARRSPFNLAGIVFEGTIQLRDPRPRRQGRDDQGRCS